MEVTNKKLLFIDDEIGILDVMTKELKERGYQIDAVSEPGDAIELLAKRNYDMIFCDLSMPSKVTAFDILRAIKRSGYLGRFYFMTGHTEGSSLMDFAVKEIGRSFVLTKPLRLNMILHILEG